MGKTGVPGVKTIVRSKGLFPPIHGGFYIRRVLPRRYSPSLLFGHMVMFFLVKNLAVRFSIYLALRIRPYGPVQKLLQVYFILF